MKKIAFYTGARSEYGILKKLLIALKNTKLVNTSLYVSGTHLLTKFGNTIDEIVADGINIDYCIKVFNETEINEYFDIGYAINQIQKILKTDKPDWLFIIGDRVEAYAAALAAHFIGIPIIHSGGGTITEGALDNIYRYNITNLSDIHLATSYSSFLRLKELPVIDKKNIYFTGSLAIDSINNYKKNIKNIDFFVPLLKKDDYCLMTFHPVTKSSEKIEEIMDFVIENILNYNINILITYPNNDCGYNKILKIIDKWKYNENIYIKKNLGAEGYYSALNDCLFVIGNSSSGIMEAPYFYKQVLNIGTRQKGRECDLNVITVPCEKKMVLEQLNKGFDNKWKNIVNKNIYGTGVALEKILEILNNLNLEDE